MLGRLKNSPARAARPAGGNSLFHVKHSRLASGGHALAGFTASKLPAHLDCVTTTDGFLAGRPRFRSFLPSTVFHLKHQHPRLKLTHVTPLSDWHLSPGRKGLTDSSGGQGGGLPGLIHREHAPPIRNESGRDPCPQIRNANTNSCLLIDG